MKTFPQLRLDTGVDIDGMLVNVQCFNKKFIHSKKFLFVNFVFFIIIGTFTVLYLTNVQPILIKKKTANHIQIINNTISHIDRLKIKFNNQDIRKFYFQQDSYFKI